MNFFKTLLSICDVPTRVILPADFAFLQSFLPARVTLFPTHKYY